VAKSDPQCWMIAPTSTETNSAWAKRRFFTAFSGMFSLFFFCFGGFGIFYSIARIRENRPGGERILKDFQ
jgi:hypothetical protein